MCNDLQQYFGVFVKFSFNCLLFIPKTARFGRTGVNLMWSFATNCVSSCVWLDKPTDSAAECGSIEPNSLEHVKFCAIVSSFAWRIGTKPHAHKQKYGFLCFLCQNMSFSCFFPTNCTSLSLFSVSFLQGLAEDKDAFQVKEQSLWKLIKPQQLAFTTKCKLINCIYWLHKPASIYLRHTAHLTN